MTHGTNHASHNHKGTIHRHIHSHRQHATVTACQNQSSPKTDLVQSWLQQMHTRKHNVLQEGSRQKSTDKTERTSWRPHQLPVSSIDLKPQLLDYQSSALFVKDSPCPSVSSENQSLDGYITNQDDNQALRRKRKSCASEDLKSVYSSSSFAERGVFEKRPRHKLRDHRHETTKARFRKGRNTANPVARNRNHKSFKMDRLRSSREIMQNFESFAISNPNQRITMKPVLTTGMFLNGRSSSPLHTEGLKAAGKGRVPNFQRGNARKKRHDIEDEYDFMTNTSGQQDKDHQLHVASNPLVSAKNPENGGLIEARIREGNRTKDPQTRGDDGNAIERYNSRDRGNPLSVADQSDTCTTHRIRKINTKENNSSPVQRRKGPLADVIVDADQDDTLKITTRELDDIRTSALPELCHQRLNYIMSVKYEDKGVMVSPTINSSRKTESTTTQTSIGTSMDFFHRRNYCDSGFQTELADIEVPKPKDARESVNAFPGLPTNEEVQKQTSAHQYNSTGGIRITAYENHHSRKPTVTHYAGIQNNGTHAKINKNSGCGDFVPEFQQYFDSLSRESQATSAANKQINRFSWQTRHSNPKHGDQFKSRGAAKTQGRWMPASSQQIHQLRFGADQTSDDALRNVARSSCGQAEGSLYDYIQRVEAEMLRKTEEHRAWNAQNTYLEDRLVTNTGPSDTSQLHVQINQNGHSIPNLGRAANHDPEFTLPCHNRISPSLLSHQEQNFVSAINSQVVNDTDMTSFWRPNYLR